MLDWSKNKTVIPEQEAKRCVLPLKVLAQQIICLQRAKDADFEFLKQIVTDPTTAEYGGFNTKMSREQGREQKQSMPHW